MVHGWYPELHDGTSKDRKLAKRCPQIRMARILLRGVARLQPETDSIRYSVLKYCTYMHDKKIQLGIIFRLD